MSFNDEIPVEYTNSDLMRKIEMEKTSLETKQKETFRSAIADLITHWNKVILKKAFALNVVTDLEAYHKLGYYEGMFDQICKGKRL